MDRGPTYFRLPPLSVLFVTALAVGCAPSYNYEPMVRQPVPTLSDERPAPREGTIVVSRGDTLYSLARQHGVALRGLIDANRLTPPYTIHPDQVLNLPRATVHTVKGGETVYAIARRYDVDMGALVRINDISPPYRIERGQKLRLPVAGTAPSDRIEVATTQPGRATRAPADKIPKSVAIPTSLPPSGIPADPSSGWNRPDPEPLKSPPPRTGRKFLWPVRGKVIVGFGARKGGLHNDGINIAASDGTDVVATENGVVAYVGNQLQGFGNLILIKHDDGWMSAYAHTSILLVRRGDVVRRGQVIARVGRTGSVGSPQLHFELRRGDRAVDPRRYLVRLAFLDGLKRFRSVAFRGGLPGPG